MNIQNVSNKKDLYNFFHERGFKIDLINNIIKVEDWSEMLIISTNSIRISKRTVNTMKRRLKKMGSNMAYAFIYNNDFTDFAIVQREIIGKEKMYCKDLNKINRLRFRSELNETIMRCFN